MFDIYTKGVTSTWDKSADKEIQIVVHRDNALSGKRREILACIADHLRTKGYPPSVREIGEVVGLASSSTVHAHLAVLEREGFIQRDPTKPRAMEIRYDPASGAALAARPVRNVPLVGSVAAGIDVLAEENVEDLLPLPEDFTGTGQLFMLAVRGESMIELGIFDGDYVVVRVQPNAEPGDVVVAGIPGPDGGPSEGTVKTYRRQGNRIVLEAANPAFAPMDFDASEVDIYGKVVTVLRRL